MTATISVAIVAAILLHAFVMFNLGRQAGNREADQRWVAAIEKAFKR